MKTVIVNNKVYRIINSTIPSGDNPIRTRFAKLRITNQVNVLAPRMRTKTTVINIFSDGHAEIADSRIDAIVARGETAR